MQSLCIYKLIFVWFYPILKLVKLNKFEKWVLSDLKVLFNSMLQQVILLKMYSL